MSPSALSPFVGTFTALVTPMEKKGACDWQALEKLVEQQLAGGVQGLVVCGSTGEAATLDEAERFEALRRVVDQVAKRCLVLFGSGTQATKTTVLAQRAAEKAGADATLVVTPFYNRPSPEGLLRHFRSVAEAAEKPILLYNVPGRTGCDMKPEVVAQLAQLPQVAGIKEATGDLERIYALRAMVRPDFALLSGDDPSACAACLMGADGVISVAANVAPQQMTQMVQASRAGEVQAARSLHQQLRPLFVAMGLETNPVPVKTALALRGICTDTLRLPLCEMQPRNRQKLQEILVAGGWLAPA